MSLFGQLVFDGLTIGLVYVILAAGLVFILSITEILFIAYGQYYMIGAYAVWYAVHLLNFPYVPSLIIGVLASAILGILSYMLIFRRLRNMEGRFLMNLAAALGISLMLSQSGLLVFGTYPRSIPRVFMGEHIIADITFSNDKIALIIMGIGVTALMFWFYEKTKIGRAMRAVSYQPEVASLQGINTYQIYLIAMGLGTALAGFAGGIIAPSYGINPQMGNNILLTVLLMTMLGGMDSLMGAVVGGVVIGLLLSFGQYFIGGLVQIVLFLIIGIIIYFKPAGLLGKRTDIGV
jgi:branched-chain amino acid transport system permease protein